MRYFIVLKDKKIIGIFDNATPATECFLGASADLMEKVETLADVKRVFDTYVGSSIYEDPALAVQQLWAYLSQGCEEVGKYIQEQGLSKEYVEKAKVEISRLKSFGVEIVDKFSKALEEATRGSNDKSRKDSDSGE